MKPEIEKKLEEDKEPVVLEPLVEATILDIETRVKRIERDIGRIEVHIEAMQEVLDRLEGPYMETDLVKALEETEYDPEL